MKHIRIIMAVAGALITIPGAQAADDNGFVSLFNGKDLSGWKVFVKSGDRTANSFVSVHHGEIHISGHPFGYIYTDKPFKNYVIRYSWTYPKDQPEKTTMNSGLLVHIQPPHKVWPKAVEPQGRYSDHGKLFFIGFGKNDTKAARFYADAHKKALKKSDEWNTTEVTAKGDGAIEVRLNGVLVSVGRSELTSGPIGFQSEGARIHLKNIQIKELK